MFNVFNNLTLKEQKSRSQNDQMVKKYKFSYGKKI